MSQRVYAAPDHIGDLEILVGLLAHDPGYWDRTEKGDVRVYRKQEPIEDAISEALYRLRGHHLIEWGERHFYDGGTAVRATGPLPILTPAGRRLALAELG